MPQANHGRRKFLLSLGKAMGASMLLSVPQLGRAGSFIPVNEPWSVGQIMDLFIKQVPGAPFPNTVDTLKSGSRDIKVTGIITSMFASMEIIQKAIDLGANFIIVHEPVFYNHLDETNWIEHDEVYQQKAKLLKKHNIAVWRNHDYVHSLRPDAVQGAVVNKLGWNKFYKPGEGSIQLPAISLEELIKQVKEKLEISTVRFIGDLSQSCQKILLMPGASGGRSHIKAISKEKPDVILCGELAEWETAEYVRDARAKGQNLSLVVMGHVDSEEPGSEFMVKWLKDNVPGVKATHVPSKNPMSFY